MSVKISEISPIPAALPIETESDAREKLLLEAAEMNERTDENLSNEIDPDEIDELVETPRISKKKLFFAFVCFIFGFCLLVLLMSWFFRLGAFAASKPQAVDRTAKPNSTNPAPVSEEDKLKMALNLVAEKNPNGTVGNVVNKTETTATNSSVDIPPTKATDLTEPVVVADPLVENSRNPVSSPSPATNLNQSKTPIPKVSSSGQSSTNNEKISNSALQPTRETSNAPLGRSLFFGVERKEVVPVNTTSITNNQKVSHNEPVNFTNQPKPSIPFGTLLPIRFLGAVYTLRASGGLVRMELIRSVSGKNYSYPAGTILVGTLRGSEDKRAFISVVGLIDSQTGELVKFAGEVMGNDGASGIRGRKRQIKNTWSRIFEGLREAGAVAVGTLGNRRSGGTVIISDAQSKVSGELSGLIGNDRNSNEFVEISAGTTGFILVTDLPDEISKTERSGQNSKTATGLSENELAELFTEGNKEKIRAALPRMTPQFRVLAEKYLAIEDK